MNRSQRKITEDNNKCKLSYSALTDKRPTSGYKELEVIFKQISQSTVWLAKIFLVTVIILGQGCGDKTVRLYSGPGLPHDRIAILKVGKNIVVSVIDHHVLYIREPSSVEVLPGSYVLQVSYESPSFKEYVRNYHDLTVHSDKFIRIPVELSGAHRYIISTRPPECFFPIGEWKKTWDSDKPPLRSIRNPGYNTRFIPASPIKTTIDVTDIDTRAVIARGEVSLIIMEVEHPKQGVSGLTGGEWVDH